jgi:hypothetical protein
MSHPYEDECGTTSHVNEDDEKLNTSTTEDRDQRRVMMIGGVEIFLPSGQEEASKNFADATKRKRTKTLEEEEQILKSIPIGGENPFELLTQWEKELKELEDWLNNLEPEGGCQEIAMP